LLLQTQTESTKLKRRFTPHLHQTQSPHKYLLKGKLR